MLYKFGILVQLAAGAEMSGELFLERFFLDRLERLVRTESLDMTPEERKLLRWAIYSTTCDCYDLGLDTQVQHILAKRQPGQQ